MASANKKKSGTLRRAKPTGAVTKKKAPKKKGPKKKGPKRKGPKKVTKNKQQRVVRKVLFGEETMSFGAKKNSKKKGKRKGPPRPPSAYNLFMKKELPGWKKLNPKASHREAFAGVAKMWSAKKR